MSTHVTLDCTGLSQALISCYNLFFTGTDQYSKCCGSMVKVSGSVSWLFMVVQSEPDVCELAGSNPGAVKYIFLSLT